MASVDTRGGWRVLAIDDDPLFLEVVQACLERSGCEVETVSDPKEGLNRAIEGTYDLILLDLMMPRMAGEEILQLLKPLSLRQRIVVISGSDEKEARERSRDLGAAGYIQKPIDTRQLTTLLYDILSERLDNGASDDVPGRRTMSELLVRFVFGEVEATPSRTWVAAGIVSGLLAVVGLLFVP